jgi:hypothetical protein
MLFEALSENISINEKKIDGKIDYEIDDFTIYTLINFSRLIGL